MHSLRRSSLISLAVLLLAECGTAVSVRVFLSITLSDNGGMGDPAASWVKENDVCRGKHIESGEMKLEPVLRPIHDLGGTAKNS